jgi:abortive infection bacteriophage resistance protein
MKYEKKALPIQDQISLLESRGLLIPDKNRAEIFLQAVSYYRLSAYAVPFECERGRNHRFVNGSSFEDLVSVYLFDHRLRMLVFDALERVETAFRTRFIHECSMTFGGWWFEVQEHFYDKSALAGFLQELDREVQHSREAFIRHYHEHYGEPVRPPAWISMEVASLGQLSKLFRNMRPNDAKKRIAAGFGVGIRVLESWLECLTYVRNTCAHHARLWNKNLTKRPMKPAVPLHAWPAWLDPDPDQNRVYPILAILWYCLKRLDTYRDFPLRIQRLLDASPLVDPASMGMPRDWASDSFWSCSKEYGNDW